MAKRDTTTLDGLGPMAMRTFVAKNHARVTWLMDRLREREERRSVASLLDELMRGPSGPGQIELAIVELSIHKDPSGKLALELWTPSSKEHEELRAACLGQML